MILRHGKRLRLTGLLLLWCVAAMPAAGITLQLDYSYDTNNFFAPGSQARASLDAAAGFFSSILNDTFSAITVPAPYHSTAPDSTGVVTWSWQQSFTNPSTGNSVSISNATIPSNQYRIFAGARAMSGTTAGQGGPGGFGWQSVISGTNSFTPSDISQINSTTSNFKNAVEKRGQLSGFARWGGAVSFDTSGRTWHYNHTTLPSGSETDLYSVAIHELAHALGFGEQDGDASKVTPWESWVSGSSFFGDNANALYGGAVPLSADKAHWAMETSSVVYGGATVQETAMDPDLTNGTRKLFTELDAAAMKDIGWTVIPLPGVHGDYNNNGIVDAADYVVWRRYLNKSATLPNDPTPGGTVTLSDYTVWRMNFGKTSVGGGGAFGGGSSAPEPGSAALVWIAVIGVYLARRKRCR